MKTSTHTQEEYSEQHVWSTSTTQNSHLAITRQPQQISSSAAGWSDVALHNTSLAFEKITYVSNFQFRPNGRVDTAYCDLNITDEHGDVLFNVDIASPGRLFSPTGKPPVTTPLRMNDNHAAAGAAANLRVAETGVYTFKLPRTENVVMAVEGENGSMVAKMISQNRYAHEGPMSTTLGSIKDDKWYKTPNFTASMSGTYGNSSFRILGNKSCLALGWFPWCNEAEFKVMSSGEEIGGFCKRPASDSADHFTLYLTQTVDVNAKGLLLAAGIIIYVAHFGETACGSSGQHGAYCCCSFL